MSLDETLLVLTSVALFGFTGSLHCLGMCGPLAAAACRSQGTGGKLSKQGLIAYAMFRILSYGVLGFAAGLTGAIVLKEGLSLKAEGLSILFASLMLIWALVDLSRGLIAVRGGKTPIPLAQDFQGSRFSFLSNKILTMPLPSGVALGIATAVLPCGFLAAAYLQAAVLGHPIVSAVAMMVFGIVTTPALVAGAIASLGVKKLLPRYASIVGSFLLVLASVLLIYRALPASKDGHHHHGT